MATESSRQQPSGFGTFLWALCFFFIFTLVVVIWVKNTGPKGGYEDKRAAERLKIREQAIADAKAKLASAEITDAAKGVARISIDDAKKLVVAELSAKKVGPSPVKLDPWLPMPAAFDPNAAEPPPPSLPSAPQGADTIRFETAAPAK